MHQLPNRSVMRQYRNAMMSLSHRDGPFRKNVFCLAVSSCSLGPKMFALQLVSKDVLLFDRRRWSECRQRNRGLLETIPRVRVNWSTNNSKFEIDLGVHSRWIRNLNRSGTRMRSKEKIMRTRKWKGSQRCVLFEKGPKGSGIVHLRSRHHCMQSFVRVHEVRISPSSLSALVDFVDTRAKD